LPRLCGIATFTTDLVEGISVEAPDIQCWAAAMNDKPEGYPYPEKVRLGYQKGKAIVVSGHDLKDMEELPKQTQGKGINIYTHGEMLSTHGYPKLKQYPHFYGQFGTAWQKHSVSKSMNYPYQ